MILAENWTSERQEHFKRVANIPREFGKAALPDFSSEVRQLAEDGLDVSDGRGLLIYGAVGTGKSRLAAALLWKHIGLGIPSLFWEIPDLLDRVRRSYGEPHTTENCLLRVQETQLVALDDIGAEHVTDWVREKLFQVVNARYNERRATIATSNLSPDELKERIGDRTVSRLVGMCKVIRLQGDDRRLRIKE